MLQFIFYKTIVTSLIGGTVGLVFLAIVGLSKKWFSNSLKYYVFIIPLMLMIMPFSLGIKDKTSVTEEITPPQAIQTEQTVNIGLKSELPTNTETASTPQLQTQTQQELNVSAQFGIDWDNVMKVLAFVWLGFLSLLIIYKTAMHAKFIKILKGITIPPTEKQIELFNTMNKKRNIKLKMFNIGGTPFITGIFRPTIYIPNIELSDYEFCMVLKHELTHIKRYDLLYKWFADLISTIHFFNPVVYLIKSKIYKLCELSCDEQVTNSMDTEQCKDYGRTILNLMKQNNLRLQSSVSLCEDEKNITNRLEIIMSTKKKSKLVSAISMILVCALSMGSVVFAGAVNEQNTAYEAKATYQGQMYTISLLENGIYDTDYHTSNGTATYTNFMGITVFRASYFGTPDDKAWEMNAYWESRNKGTDENGVSEVDLTEYKDFSEYYTDYYEVTMDKITRKFGNGFGIEGLFTLTKNGEVIFDKQAGFLSHLPPGIKTTYPNDTQLYIPYEKDGKEYEMQMSVNLWRASEEQLTANRKRNMQFNKSRDTKTVRLGEAVEIVANGQNVDVNEVNKFLIEREEWGRFHSEVQYNPTMQLATAYCPAGVSSNLSVWLGNKVSVTNDSIKGDFMLFGRIGVTDVLTMTVTGLNNPVGDFVEFQSDDGKYYAKYKIIPIIHAPLSYRGTKDLSEIEQEENVFIGTPREQDDFDRDEHDRFYQRIVLDDYGKVLLNVPTSLQQGEILNIDLGYARETILGQSWEQLIMSKGNTFLTKIDGTVIDRSGYTLVYQDPETWWIKAVIPAEYQFMEAIAERIPYRQHPITLETRESE